MKLTAKINLAWLTGALGALMLATFAAAPTAAADCARGDLDKRYCDADGDLTADLPTDKSKWINPSTLIFAYTPVEDPAVYKGVWADFITHMEKTTGKKVVFFPVQSNAAQIEAMRSGRLHVAGFNTGSNPLAVNCAGFVSFTIMASLNGHFGYEMEIITHPGSGIKKVADLKGRTLAFTAPTSNSGFKAPSAILKAEFDMMKDRDFKASFSGKHDNSILGVANKDYDAASIANSVKSRMIKRNVIKATDVITIANLPHHGFRSCLQPASGSRRQGARELQDLQVDQGRWHQDLVENRVREIQRGQVHPHYLQGTLGGDTDHRQGQRRFLLLPVETLMTLGMFERHARAAS